MPIWDPLKLHEALALGLEAGSEGIVLELPTEYDAQRFRYALNNYRRKTLDFDKLVIGVRGVTVTIRVALQPSILVIDDDGNRHPLEVMSSESDDDGDI